MLKKMMALALACAFLLTGCGGKEKYKVAGQDITLWANLDKGWKDPENSYDAYEYGVGVETLLSEDEVDFETTYIDGVFYYNQELIAMLKSLDCEKTHLKNEDVDKTIPYHVITLYGYNSVTEKQEENEVQFWFFDDFNYVVGANFYDMGVYKVNNPEVVKQFFIDYVLPDINRYRDEPYVLN